MLSKDDLIKAKRAQQDKEKEEIYLRYQEIQKAEAAEHARINEVLQILRQYPTLAKNVNKQTKSIPCFDGFRHAGLFGLFRNAKFTDRNAWHIGRVDDRSSISPYWGSEKQKECERNMIIGSAAGHVNEVKEGTYCYIDEAGQCWVQVSYTYADVKGKRVYYPVNTEDMAKALWKYCINQYDWKIRASNIYSHESRYDFNTGPEQLVDEYFKLNLLS